MTNPKEIHHHHYHQTFGIGMVLAVILSWIKWHSIGWAIVNGFFGWLYVIYHLIKYGFPQT